MAGFAKEVTHGNLPNGNFSPVIYSKQVQLAFRKSTVVGDITNSDYFGEISNQGDTVRIIKEPEISVSEYKRGTQITAQDLDDEDFSLVVDKANYYAFKMDDIEEAQSHVNFMDLATSRAAYRLADQYDQECLGYLSGYSQGSLHAVAGTLNTTANGTKALTSASDGSGSTGAELLAENTLTSASFGHINSPGSNNAIPVANLPNGATSIGTANCTPMMIVNRFNRLLNQQQVDTQDRWLVIDPVFMEQLADEHSKLVNADYADASVKNGLTLSNLAGFRVYVSSNLPSVGSGAGTAAAMNNTNYGVIVAGHGSAVATAEQISKTETYRDPDSFADIVRGMHLYGRKILRPEAIVTAKYHLA